MSVSKVLKKAAAKYVDKFKKDPEGMAVSYAFLFAGYCLAYGSLLVAVHEIEKKENAIANMEFAIAKHNAYIDGVYDTYKQHSNHENPDQW